MSKNNNIKKHTTILLHSILLLITGILSSCSGAGAQVDVERAQLLERVRNGEIDFSTASPELTGDREVMMTAVNQNGNNLQYASDTLKADYNLVLAAIRQNVFAFWQAAQTLRNDRTIGMEAVRNSAYVFQDTPQFWGNREIAFIAVGHRGWDIHWTLEVTNELINDEELVFEAVSQDGRALKFASDALRKDKTVVMKAISQNGLALEHASEAFRADEELVFEAVSQDGRALQFASDALREDKTVVMKAISQNGLALEHASEAFRADREIVIYAMRRNREAFQFVSQALQQEEQELEAAANSCIEVENALNTIVFTLDERKTDEAGIGYIQVLASLSGERTSIPLIHNENIADFATRLRVEKFPEQENIYLTLITKQGTSISPLSWNQPVIDFVQ